MDLLCQRPQFMTRKKLLAAVVANIMSEQEKLNQHMSQATTLAYADYLTSFRKHSFFGMLPVLSRTGKILGKGKFTNITYTFANSPIILEAVNEIVQARVPELGGERVVRDLTPDAVYIILHYACTDIIPQLYFSFMAIWETFLWSLRNTSTYRLQYSLMRYLLYMPKTMLVMVANKLYVIVSNEEIEMTESETFLDKSKLGETRKKRLDQNSVLYTQLLFNHVKAVLKELSRADSINLVPNIEEINRDVMFQIFTGQCAPCPQNLSIPESTMERDMSTLMNSGTGDICVAYDLVGMHTQMLHLRILAYHSEWFANVKAGTVVPLYGWCVGEDGEVTSEQIAITKQLFTYFYTGNCGEINQRNAVPLYMAADYFLLPSDRDIMCKCRDVIIEHVDKDTCNDVWNALVAYREDDRKIALIKHACKNIAMNKPNLD
jgi:hypothetical protein